MQTFEEFKTEILARAKRANACEGQYKLAYASTNYAELFDVIKANFGYCCNNGIIDAPMLEQVRDEAAKCDVWLNVSVKSGYLLATDNSMVRATGNSMVRATDNSTVRAYGSATVEAYGNSTVEAYDNSTVRAYGNSTVEAYDNSTVEAYGSATVEASDSAYINVRSDMECKISDKAIMRYRDTDEIVIAKGSLKVKNV